MQKTGIIASILFFLFACHSTKQSMGDNHLSSSEKNNGWTLLFDGKTTKGWHRYGAGAIDSVWKIKEDVLCLDAPNKKAKNIKGDWDIVTDEEYENFELQVEWKVSKNANSGIIFMIHEDKKKFNWPWETGPEMQVLDNEGHPDAKIVKHRAGDLYDLVACSRETVRPYGEWNQAGIKFLNGKLDLYLNGVNVVSTTVGDDNWKKLVANSKWKSYPSFATYRKGHIGLQDHGDEVCYRNIKIRRL